MTGVWPQKKESSAAFMLQVTKDMEAVHQLAVTLSENWLDGDLIIDYVHKHFWGDDLHPQVEQGLLNLGFKRK